VNQVNLKKLLKTLKLNESRLSMFLGVFVIAIAAIMVLRNFRKTVNDNTTLTNEQVTQTSSETSILTHKVEKGESLWTIAEKYYKSGYKWVDIAKANKILNSNSIEKNQELVIPTLEPIAKADTLGDSIISNKDEATNSISGANYTVQKDDNLWKIAVRAYGDGYQWVKISRENKLTHPGLIHPGNVLTLPR